MGYAVVMFGVLLVMSVVMITVVNYGIAKDSQIAPLKAENIYADRETGKAQTLLTINNTCLSDPGRYIDAQGSQPGSTHTLYLTVKNNGSIVLNPNNVTLLYNVSYKAFTVTNIENKVDEVCEDITGQDISKVWSPETYVCMKSSNIYIATPDSPLPGNEIRLAVVAENGVSTIAPTAPTNFTGLRPPSNTSYTFSWTASYDEDGIAYYRLYAIANAGDIGTCPAQSYAVLQIPGNIVNMYFDYDLYCSPCNTDYFYLTAVDNLGNEGVQSRTLKCNPSPGPCTY